MTEITNSKKYDLEERTFNFARRCRDYVEKLPKTISNIEYGSQLIRSSGSQGFFDENEASPPVEGRGFSFEKGSRFAGKATILASFIPASGKTGYSEARNKNLQKRDKGKRSLASINPTKGRK